MSFIIALISTNQPEKALEVFETALKRNARDSVLASKIGQCLIKTHNYSKAIVYYETALKSEAQQFLRKDLAELYLKLRQYERAEKTLNVELEGKEEPTEVFRIAERIEYLLLLAKVYGDAKSNQKCLATLTNASQLQSK